MELETNEIKTFKGNRKDISMFFHYDQSQDPGKRFRPFR